MTTLTSIKLPTPLVNAARKDAKLFSRSIGGQVAYWASIGRAVGESPTFSLERVRAALNGQHGAEALTDSEFAIFEDLLGTVMDGKHTVEAREFWAGFGNVQSSAP